MEMARFRAILALVLPAAPNEHDAGPCNRDTCVMERENLVDPVKFVELFTFLAKDHWFMRNGIMLFFYLKKNYRLAHRVEIH
jgi:hypothetical protein